MTGDEPADLVYEGKTLTRWIADLRDHRAHVRWKAALALAVMGASAKAAAPALKTALHDTDRQVRIAAQEALAAIEHSTIGEPSRLASKARGGSPSPPKPQQRPRTPAGEDVAPFPVVRIRDLSWGRKEAVVITTESILRVRGWFKPTERFCDTGDPANLGRVTVDRLQ